VQSPEQSSKKNAKLAFQRYQKLPATPNKHVGLNSLNSILAKLKMSNSVEASL
jgi:hypothetical protein